MSNAPYANIGCGSTPTAGWANFDNSPTIRLAGFPALAKALAAFGLISSEQGRFIQVARLEGIRYADASSLPIASRSLLGLYSSHMLEHLSRREAEGFLKEAFRVLRPGGVIRVSVPDLAKLVDEYRQHQSADDLLRKLMLTTNMESRVQRLQLALVGPRNHQWMYDERSLTALLVSVGFVEVNRPLSDQTRISDHANLNLREREAESLILEAIRPQGDPVP